MILISKLYKNPECLEKHKKSGDDYSKLSSECGKKTKAILYSNQNGFCAYCEQKLDSVFIEHFISQSADKEKKFILEISNYLGVCSGKSYTNLEDHSNNHIQHCDTSRDDKDLSLDPREKLHISTLLFNSEAKLESSNGKFQDDLDITLNLNCEILCNKRGKAFASALDNLIFGKQKFGFNYSDLVKNAYKEVCEHKYEFTTYLISQFGKLMNPIV